MPLAKEDGNRADQFLMESSKSLIRQGGRTVDQKCRRWLGRGE
jgi:hypothetical protein